MIVTEGVESTFHYHLSPDTDPRMGYCGRRTFRTNIPVKAWGAEDHLPSKWCAECAHLAGLKTSHPKDSSK